MGKREIRPLVLQALREQPDTQFVNIEHRVRGLLTPTDTFDELLIREVIWDLIIQGIVSPGFNQHNLDFPFIHVTEYGSECLATDTFLPHDPDGYLIRLQGLLGNELDEIILRYIQESLATFLSGNFMAATVMIGVASERCVDLLVDALIQATIDETEASSLERDIRRAGRSVKRRFDVVREKIISLELPMGLRDALDIQLSGVFTLIRYSRNDAGHPSNIIVGRDEIHANLLLFPQYCKRVYELIDFFKTNQIDDN